MNAFAQFAVNVLACIVLLDAASAQFTPNAGTSIALLNSVANSSTASAEAKQEAGAAAQTVKEVDGNKSLTMDDQHMDMRSDGKTLRVPQTPRRGNATTPPERYETVGVNGKKMDERYADMIDRGLSAADATAACNWIVALILAHECVHVNQSNENTPNITNFEREMEAYAVERAVATGATSDPGMDPDVEAEIERFEAESNHLQILITALMSI